MTLRATYRLQFHRDFTFDDARTLAPYFGALGVSHIYSSPILTARAGSTHGYDVVDHSRVNPELGGETAFRELAAALREHGIGILLDIVPNHMAVGGADNPYWLDVLEKGPDSVFANMFDIDWDAGPSSARDKIVVPMLGKPLAECLAGGEIALVWDARLGKFTFSYGDNRFPVRLDDYAMIADVGVDPASADLSRFANSDALARLLSRQHFRLAFWRDAGNRINWRRFFDITSLAAVRVEDDAIFEQTHAAIVRLFGEGFIDGVRVDHVDGLADPAAYCRRLRARLEALLPQRPESLPREPAIIVVEKILADGEALPGDWGADGTTGYDFMNLISAVQHDPSSDAAFTRLWTDVSGRPPDFEMEERAARRDMLSTAFANALRVAAAAFAPLGNDGDAGNDVAAIQCAISLTIERFRAYRTYAVGDSREPAPGALFEDAVCSAAADAAGPVRRALDLVASVVRGDAASGGGDARDAVRRFNQLAAPIAAKAVEDTACYRYGRLLSRNDVGFSPGRFSMSVAEFHRHNAAQADAFPRTLVTTATHDHKRGEDARARLAALSELPAEWAHAVDAWFAMNAPRRPAGIGRGDEYQLYQTLIGAWPVELAASDADGLAAFEERILAWRVKSLREAKLETSWDRPNGAFENAHKAFVGSLLAPSQPFVEGLASFVARLAPAGALNSLAACALRCTSPGVPDLYQGDEAWDLTLVDPDNRRPVDFDRRRALLSAGGARDLPELLGEWSSGAVKATLIARLLALRARVPSVFLSGAYVPIETSSERILAFARTDETAVVLVAVPRLCANDAVVSATPLPAPGQHRWRDLSLPSAWRHREWRDVLSRDAPVVARADGDAIFDRFPAVVLLSA